MHLLASSFISEWTPWSLSTWYSGRHANNVTNTPRSGKICNNLGYIQRLLARKRRSSPLNGGLKRCWDSRITQKICNRKSRGACKQRTGQIEKPVPGRLIRGYNAQLPVRRWTVIGSTIARGDHPRYLESKIAPVSTRLSPPMRFNDDNSCASEYQVFR